MKKFFLYASISTCMVLFSSLGEASSNSPLMETGVIYILHPEGGSDTSIIGEGCKASSSHTPPSSHKLNKCTPVKKVHVLISTLSKYE